MKKVKILTADMTTYRREYMRQYRKDHPEKTRSANRAWYARNREQQCERLRESYETDEWPRHLQRKYGLSTTQFGEMLARQGGGCAICAVKTPGGRGKKFHVDHDHGTGKVRDLLCNTCNRMIGFAQDDPAILDVAAQYLRRHKEAS